MTNGVYDVIIGGGPVGCALAIELSIHNIKHFFLKNIPTKKTKSAILKCENIRAFYVLGE